MSVPVRDSFDAALREHWMSLTRLLGQDAQAVKIDGHKLDIAAIVAVSRHGVPSSVINGSLSAVKESEQSLRDSLDRGQVIYGVNTGFGGSADTRTNKVVKLQKELILCLHCGILPQTSDNGKHNGKVTQDITNGVSRPASFANALPLDDPDSATVMPESWVRAAMLVRLNSIVRGVSGVQVHTIKALNELLLHDITPMVPLRGSISASGDLSPLSYIGGVLQGNRTLKAWAGDRSTGNRRLMSCDKALAEAKISAIKLGPKEGLAIVNGTAFSAATAALALHEISLQAALSQILTAMSVEALKGTDESFDPFLAQVRPHPGQIESAKNIFGFLQGSKLVHHEDGSEDATLRQDRYSIRTASQWIGPVLEDLLLANKQVTTELNSVTDNPLIDATQNHIFHGGNFQARAVTSAVEKTRQGCQTLGRMLFVQCTELINHALNRGLPPNLVADEPSESFLFKSVDISIAALQSELGFLANPVGTHVQYAEMGNQALNSLALISTRYTLTAAEVLTQLSAAHLTCLCQALDLRALQNRFLDSFCEEFYSIAKADFKHLLDYHQLSEMTAKLWRAFKRRLDQSTTLDSEDRFKSATKSLHAQIIDGLPSSTEAMVALKNWTEKTHGAALASYKAAREAYISKPDAGKLLGKAASRMYRYVRHDLGVPFVATRTEPTTDGATYGNADIVEINGFQQDDSEQPTVGELVGRVYHAMRNGKLYHVVMECMEEGWANADNVQSNTSAKRSAPAGDEAKAEELHNGVVPSGDLPVEEDVVAL